MTSRIKTCFERLKSDNRCALVTYVTAGDPDAAATKKLMTALVEGGADIVELGVPFSDPMADGPTIQRASERALAGGMSLRGVLKICREFRATDAETPIVLMGYLNPIEAMGYDVFAAEADAVGVDGVLVVDDPPEEAGPLHASLAARGLDQVFLVAPNSPAGRIAEIGKLASGFVYYVSVKGVTGDKQLDTTEVGNKVARFRDKLPVPVGVGFGIRTPDAAAGVARICDAVIVGSVIIDIVEQHEADVDAGSDDVRVLVSRFRDALDEARRRAA